MMNRFTQHLDSPTSTGNFDELNSFFPNSEIGSVSSSHVNSEMHMETTNLTELLFQQDLVTPIGGMSQHALHSYEITCVTDMYRAVLPSFKVLHVSCLCYRFSRVKLAGKLISSQMARSDRSSYVSTNWLNGTRLSSYRPGRIKFFFRHNLTLQGPDKENVSIQVHLAHIEWYKYHPEINFLHSPVSIWNPEFEPIGVASLPISRIASRCAQTITSISFTERPYNNGKVTITVSIDSIDVS